MLHLPIGLIYSKHSMEYKAMIICILLCRVLMNRDYERNINFENYSLVYLMYNSIWKMVNQISCIRLYIILF